MLRRDDDNALRVALDLEMSGNRKRGPKKTWKKQMEEETEKIGLKEDAMIRANGVTERKHLWKKLCEPGHIYKDNIG